MTDEDEESSSRWPLSRLLDEDRRRRRTSLKLEYLKKIEMTFHIIPLVTRLWTIQTICDTLSDTLRGTLSDTLRGRCHMERGDFPKCHVTFDIS